MLRSWLSICLLAAAPLTHAGTPATWIGGTGSYSVGGNWDIGVAPCNGGPDTYDVTFPPGPYTVTLDVAACTVDTLLLDVDAEFVLPAANAYAILGQADISGTVDDQGGSFSAPVAGFPGNSARLLTSAGGTTTVGASSYSSSALVESTTILSAVNAATVLDLSALTTLDAQFADANASSVKSHVVDAAGGGSIDLSGVVNLFPPAGSRDRLTFQANGGGTIDLSSLTTIEDTTGRAQFLINDGATLALPQLAETGTSSYLVNNGGRIEVNGATPILYDASGFSGASTMFRADGAGSHLDLSALSEIQGWLNFQLNISSLDIQAWNGGTIDLSSVETIRAPTGVSDTIEIETTTGGSIDLSGLRQVLASTGRVFMLIQDGATLHLPVAESLSNTGLFALGGSQIIIDGPATEFDTSGYDFSFTAMSVSGAGSLLDAPAITVVRDGFNDGSISARTHFFAVGTDATINLPNVFSFNVASRSEDTTLIRSTGGTFNMPKLSSIGGGGNATLSVSSGGQMIVGDLVLSGRRSLTLATGGSFIASRLTKGSNFTTVPINLDNADVTLHVGTLDLGRALDLNVVEPMTTITIEDAFLHEHLVETRVQLEEAILQTSGAGPQRVEVAGSDLGSARPASENFGIGQLVVGEPAQSTLVLLQDLAGSGNGAPGEEALYLLGLDSGATATPAGLRIHPGSTLSLGCLDTYVFDDDADPTGTLLNDLFIGQETATLAYDQGFLQLDADSDGDGVLDCVDNCKLVANASQADGDGDGVGDRCQNIFLLDDPANAEAIPGFNFRSLLGYGLAAAGDMNLDGIDDFLAGAVQYDDPPAPADGGAAVVFFGAADPLERATADVIFHAEESDDRVGIAIAGDFDFNGDGFNDILVGADQWERSDQPGKVYLIYFDPTDGVTYPNLGDPLTPDILDLARVGNGLADEIPGVVFEGFTTRGQFGFSVDAGTNVGGGPGPDLLIGAPELEAGGSGNGGRAFVIFDDPTLSGSIALDRVANGLPDQIEGAVIEGGFIYDETGTAVTFTGDIVGGVGDDLAISAPLSNAGGTVFAIEGGALVTGVYDAAEIGVGGLVGARLESNVSERMGEALAAGGDMDGNGEGDLLIGAPRFERLGVNPGGNAGRVIQLLTKLPVGVQAVEQIRPPGSAPGGMEGLIWIGAQSGHMLGAHVASLRDIDGDGTDDVAFSAPQADTAFAGDGGITYLLTDIVAPLTSEIDLFEGFAGPQFYGTIGGERAGLTLAGPGDIDADGRNDLLIGAPDAFSVASQAGYIYIARICGIEDGDGDGVADCEDNCPLVANVAQDDADGDRIGDLCDVCPNDADDDVDADGLCADVDNCPLVANPAQADGDADGIGDPCDACPVDPDNDIDADGVCGDVDNCPTLPNADQSDVDGNGVGDVCDIVPVALAFNPPTLSLQAGESALVAIEATGGLLPWLAAFQLDLDFDANVADTLNPNEAFRGTIAPFAPLGGDALCTAVRGTPSCDDPPWHLTSTGRTPFGADTIASGHVEIAWATAGSQVLPNQSGAIALIEIVAVGGGSTAVTLSNVIVANDDQPPFAYPLDAPGTLAITVANRAPVLDPIGLQSGEAGLAFGFPLSSSDPDPGDSLTLTVLGLPPFCTLTDAGDGTGTIDCTPAFADVGDFALTVTTTDSGSPQLADSEAFTLSVLTASSCNDSDGDRYGAPGDPSCPAGAAEDCNDGDPLINPARTELCRNGLDDDCDGETDAAHAPCASPTCIEIALGATALDDPTLAVGDPTSCPTGNVLIRQGDAIRGEVAQIGAVGGEVRLGTVVPIGCAATDGAYLFDVLRPDPGVVEFYLVREAGAGSYGTSSVGEPRLADAGDCP